MNAWKPIETAPKNDTRIRVKRDDLEDTVEWFVCSNDWLLERDPEGVIMNCFRGNQPIGCHWAQARTSQ
jgi:hypothetical protein